ncbi:amino acid adenylation domain-containing protein [Rhodococcus sp. NPDC058521]|uniref:non-ribosomal peptide synthetase n=1 Tax=Rhodococcus sp. NPDC058521 TaxID=3346536 RepID=UPI003658ECC9
MTPHELLGQLRNSGVKLWIDGENLRFSAPRGVLSADLKSALVEAKPEVMAIIAAEETVVSEPDNRYAPFPLTDVQASYLLGRTNAFRWGGVGCHGYAEFLLDPESNTAGVEAPDAASIRAAWHKVVARHEMLRCIVHPDGYQYVEPLADDSTSEAVHGLTIHTSDSAAQVDRLREELAQTLAHRSYTPGTGPMFDLVVTIGPEDTVVHFSVDLLIADFVSIAIVMRDFERCLLDTEVELAPFDFSFRDYVLNLTRSDVSAIEAQKRQRDLDYWQSRLDTLPPPIALPLVPEREDGGDESSGDESKPTFTRRSLRLTPEQWSTFLGCTSERALTPNAAMLAAFGRALGRYGDRDHFLLMLTTMNRRPLTPEVAELVGDFTGTSALEVDVRAEETFAGAARRVGERLFEDMDHYRVSGVDIVRQLARRDNNLGEQSPVVFTSTLGAARGQVAGHEQTGGILIPRTDRGLSQTPQVLLDCQVTEMHGGVEVNWDTRDDAIAPDILDRAFADFGDALTALCSDRGSWDRVLLPATAPESTRLDWTGVQAGSLLHSGFLRQTQRTPDAIAVRHGDRAVTYAELASAAAAVADELRVAEVRRGDYVGVRLEQGADQIAAIVGALLCGAAYVPIDVRWPDARVSQIAEQCQLSALVDPASSIAERLSRPETWSTPMPDADLQGHLRSEVDPGDVAYVIFTSGSTGTPKGVELSHAAVVNTIDDLNERFDITATDAVLAVSQHTFDLSVYNIFGLLAVGGSVVVPEGTDRSNPQAWLHAIDQHGVTVWNSVPAQMQLLLEHAQTERPAGAAALPGLRRIMLSGDWIPVTQPDSIAQAAPEALAFSLGGATEAAIWSICHPLGGEQYQRSVPYGRALRNQSIHVLTHRGEPAAPGQIGEIHIGGVGLALGYLGDEQRTAQSFVTHPLSGERLYRTGDYGRTRNDGVVELLGRRDNQVKIRGHRIELAEVEAALGRLDGVAAAVACVIGDRHHSTLGARVVPGPADGDEICRRRDTSAAVALAAQQTHRRLTQDLAEDALTTFAEAAKSAALHSMVAALSTVAEAGEWIGLDELGRRMNAPIGHRRLLHRWVDVLVEEGFAQHQGSELALTTTFDLDRCVRQWQHVRALARDIDYGDDLLAYVERCIEDLPGLMAGRIDPLALLFPEGSTDTAAAAYRDNLLSRYANGVVVAAVTERAKRHDAAGPLRILEVGAGVGGTSKELVEALAEYNVHYTFTDVSQFFLGQAREMFAEYDFVDYRKFDLNTDPALQGFAAASFDVIICANVLHNATHVEECLARLDGLLIPGGALGFIDSTVTNHPLMISMEFKEGLEGFTDARAQGNSTFLTYAQWNDVLDRSEFGSVFSFPPPGHVLDKLGQHVFWCESDSLAHALRTSTVTAAAQQVLPGYMVPQHIAVVPELALTANGKIDRASVAADLQRLLSARAETMSEADGDGGLDEMQTRIGQIWAAVLGLPDARTLTPQSDFFGLGGDSLLLAQTIGRMRQEIPEAGASAWDNLLRAMVSDPSLAGAANAVQGGDNPGGGDTGSADPVTSPLVRLSPGDPGSPGTDTSGRPVAVFVHDGSGGVRPYDKLVEALAAHATAQTEVDAPALYGVRRVPGDGYLEIAPGELFTTLAARYSEAIIALAPSQVHLVGYCMGGLLSAEIAKYLEEAGVRVADLTVVSSYRLPLEIDDEDVLDYCFAQIMGVRAEDLGLPSDDEAFVEAFAQARAVHEDVIPAGTLRQLSPSLAAALADGPEPGEQRMKVLASSGALGQGWTVESLLELRSVFLHSLRAVVRGAQEPYLGDIHFLRQRGDIHFLPTLKEDMTDFWHEYCLGDLAITEIEGNHFDCLTGDNAHAVADLLVGSWGTTVEVGA